MTENQDKSIFNILIMISKDIENLHFLIQVLNERIDEMEERGK
jgi:hypothetical protein